jgi:hypothetical protein
MQTTILGKRVPRPSGTATLVARNGLFIQKENVAFAATVPVTQLNHLQEVKSEVTLKVPPLPGELFQEAFLFFREVFSVYRSESILLLYYSAEKGYLLYAPGQRVDFASIDYDEAIRIEGYALIGSIHSHGSMSAFHSGTDLHDEVTFDGIHVTVGNLRPGDNHFSLSCQIAVNGNRFELEPEKVLDGMVRCAERYVPLIGNNLLSLGIYAKSIPYKEFKIELLGDVDPGFPEVWFSQVSQRPFRQFLPGVSTMDSPLITLPSLRLLEE